MRIIIASDSTRSRPVDEETEGLSGEDLAHLLARLHPAHQVGGAALEEEAHRQSQEVADELKGDRHIEEALERRQDPAARDEGRTGPRPVRQARRE